MNTSRMKILVGVAVVLAAALVWNWIAGWGLVTVDVKGVALQKVIRSIERQGGVTFASAIDPTTPVRMDVYRVPVAEAVEVLASAVDADWSVVYAAGPGKAEAKVAVDALVDGSVREGGFRMFRAGGGPFMALSGDIVPDPRLVTWTVSEMEPGELQGYTDQFAQKTGATVLLPTDWNPSVTKIPESGEARKAIGELIASAGGTTNEVFYLREGGRWGGPPPTANADQSGNQQAAAGRDGGQRDRGERGDRAEPNREWMAERAEAQIAMLPADQQVEAREEFTRMRDLFAEARDLPEEERRAKFEAFFNDPKVQARMDERRSLREDRSSPEKKANRARRYVERKQQRKNS